MKITIKTLQQKVFQIDAELTDTVGDLKAKIQETQGHSAETMKIIYSGKILQDSKTVESLEIKEKDFLVVMVSKPKPTPSPVPAASSSTPTAPASVPVVPAAAPSPDAPSITAASSPAPATTPAPQPGFGEMGSFLSGDALQSTINNMVEMGFTREQVLRALRASYNNPDRAVEYLMNGIPAHLDSEDAGNEAPRAAPAPVTQTPAPASTGDATATPGTQPQVAPAQPNAPQNLFQLAQQQQQQQGGAPGAGGGNNPLGGRGAGIDMASLRDTPQIQQLRELIAQNPALIQPLIQQLASSNPAIAQAINQNPEALAQLFGTQGDGDEGPIPPGAHVISVSEEDRAAIERLEAMGFPRQTVIEAYLACDRNEELAANYLFENGYED